jgi:TRAP-type C4-dicarboxylate transport system permease small subunit
MAGVSAPQDEERSRGAANSRDRHLRSINRTLNLCGSMIIVVLMVLVNSDVIGRYIFNSPVRGVSEIISLAIVALVFLQLPHTVYSGRLTRSDAILPKVLKAWPRFGAFLQAIYHTLGIILMGIIFYAMVPTFMRSWREDVFIGVRGDFTAPYWPLHLIVLIGAFAVALVFLVLVRSDIAAIFGKEVPDDETPSGII